MVYMKTCCFCYNTRNGSIACGVYTMVLKGIATAWIITRFLLLPSKQEIQASEITMALIVHIDAMRAALTISLVYCLTFEIVSGLLIYGVKKNRPGFLLPWIVAMSVEVAILIINLIAALFATIAFSSLYIGVTVGIVFGLTIFAGFEIYTILCVESVRKLLERNYFYPPTDAIKLSQSEEDGIILTSP